VQKDKAGLLVDAVDANTAKELNAMYKQLQIKNLEAKLENLGYKNRIDAVRATAAETFNGKISPSAEKAIEQRFESQNHRQQHSSASMRLCDSWNHAS
jgi:hypothetical protein